MTIKAHRSGRRRVSGACRSSCLQRAARMDKAGRHQGNEGVSGTDVAVRQIAGCRRRVARLITLDVVQFHATVVKKLPDRMTEFGGSSACL